MASRLQSPGVQPCTAQRLRGVGGAALERPASKPPRRRRCRHRPHRTPLRLSPRVCKRRSRQRTIRRRARPQPQGPTRPVRVRRRQARSSPGHRRTARPPPRHATCQPRTLTPRRRHHLQMPRRRPPLKAPTHSWKQPHRRRRRRTPWPQLPPRTAQRRPAPVHRCSPYCLAVAPQSAPSRHAARKTRPPRVPESQPPQLLSPPPLRRHCHPHSKPRPRRCLTPPVRRRAVRLPFPRVQRRVHRRPPPPPPPHALLVLHSRGPPHCLRRRARGCPGRRPPPPPDQDAVPVLHSRMPRRMRRRHHPPPCRAPP